MAHALTIGRRLPRCTKAFREARASLRIASAERGFLALGFRGLYGRWLNFEPAGRGFPVLRGFAVTFLAGLLPAVGEPRLEDGRLGLVGIVVGRPVCFDSLANSLTQAAKGAAMRLPIFKSFLQ
jgi:hypothetical protein